MGKRLMGQPILDLNQLPADPVARREVLELRTLPNDEKPKLPVEIEAALAAIEERCAQQYLDLEELTYRAHKLSKRLSNGVIPCGALRVRTTTPYELDEEKTDPERKSR